MHESLMYHQIPEVPKGISSNHKPKPYQDMPAPTDLPLEDAAGAPRSSSERIFNSLPVAKSGFLFKPATPNTLQADSFRFASTMIKSSPSSSTNQHPFSWDTALSSSSSCLATDHVHAPVIEPTLNLESRNSDFEAVSNLLHLTTPDSTENLSWKEANATPTVLPGNQEKGTFLNGARQIDIDTDNFYIHIMQHNALGAVLCDDIILEE